MARPKKVKETPIKLMSKYEIMTGGSSIEIGVNHGWMVTFDVREDEDDNYRETKEQSGDYLHFCSHTAKQMAQAFTEMAELLEVKEAEREKEWKAKQLPKTKKKKVVAKKKVAKKKAASVQLKKDGTPKKKPGRKPKKK